MALTTVANVRLMGGAGAVAFSDGQLNYLISGITDDIKRTVHRDIEQASYLEYYSGNNSSILQLRQIPVMSVQRVCVDYNGHFGQSPNAFPAADDLVQGVDYSIMAGQHGIGSSGCLRRINQVWWRGRSYAPGKVAPQPSPDNGSILVQYTAGYSPAPYAIQMAVNQAVLDAANRMVAGGPVSSESYQGAASSYYSPELFIKIIGSVQQVLSSIRMPVV